MAKSKLRDLSEKRRKLGNGEQNASTTTAAATPADIDRISDLPDCLLCHILSFLPTTTSVATTLLSRRWRRIWQDLQAFDFNCVPFLRGGQLSQENANLRLFAFVNAVLARRTSRDIRKFRLTCCATQSDKTAIIDTWIGAAVGPHLEELRLDLSAFSWDWVLPVPPNVFSCTALVTLILTGMLVTVEPNQRSSFYLPSLKDLELHLESTDNVDTLLSGCPVLEKLSLTFYGWHSPPSAPKIIRVPSSLKSLSITDLTCCGFEALEIDTPSLEYLNIFAMEMQQQQLSVRNLHSVVDASLDLCQPESLLKLLRELRNARHLRMWPSAVTCLLRAPLDLPEFECLLQLRLTLPRFDTRFVMNMLEKCHMLQVLRIDKSEGAPRRWNWKLPINVPSCLVSHLSRITFSKYHGSEDDREFITYILREGLVLKSVKIYVDWWEKLRIQEELPLTSRGSKMCQFYIY